MRVRYTKNHGGRRVGLDYDLPEEEAKAAIKAKVAEDSTPEPLKDDKGDATMRIRLRGPVTLDGHDLPAGSMQRVKVSDEAWELVNSGQAELDPAPGIQGQPFPPQEIQHSEAPSSPDAIQASPATTARINTRRPVPEASAAVLPTPPPDEPSRLGKLDGK